MSLSLVGTSLSRYLKTAVGLGSRAEDAMADMVFVNVSVAEVGCTALYQIGYWRFASTRDF